MLRSVDGWEGEHFAFGGADASPGAAPSSVSIVNGADGPSATIPDAHLLFTAQFARAGSDLVLHGDDGKSFVVHDYFASDVHARLLSPEGAALSADIVDRLVGPQAPGQYAQAGAAPGTAQVVGRVVQADADSTLIRNGVAIAAHSGDPIQKGDVLQTVSGTVSVTFNDGSTLNLTANTRMVVNEFVYDPRGSQNSQLLDLVQGSLTFISGEVAHTGNMRIGTPVATMGIRGTVGGVTTANDGTVNFYVSQSATGAVILDSRGNIVANVVQDGPMIVVRPAGPLQIIAEEIQKTPSQLATELAALQQIVNIKAVADQIMQQFLTQDPNNPPNPNPNPQSTDKPQTHIQIFTDPAKNGPDGTAPTHDGDPNFTSATVTTTTSNPDGTSTTHVIDVPLPHVNHAPVATPIVLTLTEDASPQTIEGLNGAKDPDGDALHVDPATVVLSSSDGQGHALPHAVSYSINGSQVQLDPAQFNYLGAGEKAVLVATYDVVDSNGARVSTSATVTVNGVNDAPVLDYFNVAVTEGGTTVLSLSDFHVTDPDSTAFTFSVSNVTGGHFEVASGEGQGLAAHAGCESGVMTFTLEDIAQGRVSFVHDGGEATPTFTVSVSDGQGGSSDPVSETVDVMPAAVNTAPVFEQQSYAFNAIENAAFGVIVGTVLATDADADVLAYSIASGNDDHVFSIDAAGNIHVAGVLDYESFTSRDLVISASDGDALAATTSVHIAITDVSEPSYATLTSSAGVVIDLTQYGATNGFVLPGGGNVTTPGTPEDRISLGYVLGDSTFVKTADPMSSQYGFSPLASAAYFSGGTGFFTTVMSADHNVTLSQTIALGSDANFFTTTIDLFNGNSNEITDVRFMRNIDPDQDISPFGTYYTRNDVIQNPSAFDSGAAVSAVGPSSGAAVVLVGSEGDWRASAFGFTNTNPYDAAAFDNPQDPQGALNDIAISLTSQIGTIAAGEHAQVSFITTANVATTGANALVGTAGNDQIDGKGGTDILFGLNGADGFVFKAGYGAATIADFSGHAGQGDHIDLYAFEFASFTELADGGHIHDIDRGGGAHDTLINLGAGDAITLHGVEAATLVASDFNFHQYIV